LALEQPVVLHLERHRHPGHVAFDVLMLDDHFTAFGTHGEDLTLRLIFTRRSLSRAAAAGYDERSHQRNPKNPHSVHCITHVTPNAQCRMSNAECIMLNARFDALSIEHRALSLEH